jgi:hypothetical protein
MSNLKISQLTPGGPAQSGDVIPIERADVNFSITAGSIAALAPTTPPGGSSGDIQFNNGAGGFAGSLATLTSGGTLTIPAGQSLTVLGTTSFVAGTIAIAALAYDTIGLTDSTGLFTVTGSPATLGGSLTLSAFASQSQNYILAGPGSGGSGAASFRALVAADIPSLSGTYLPLAGGTMTGNIKMTSGTVVDWNADAGISRIAPATLAIGDGVAGDVSGAAAMSALLLYGSSGYDYYYETSYTAIYSGATQDWNLVLPTGPGSNGQYLQTNGHGVTSWVTISTTETWAALTGDLTETQVIPWDGPTVGTKDTGISRLAAGSLAIGNGTAGDSSGTLLASIYGFGATVASTAPDTGISRIGAASLAIGNGTAGDFSGSLKLGAGSSGSPSLIIGTAGCGLWETGGTPVIVSTNGTICDFYENTTLQFDIFAGSNLIQLNANGTGNGAGLRGNITSSATPAIVFGNSTNFTATTSTTQIGVQIGGTITSYGLTFNPASGTASFIACDIVPTIKGTSSGNTTALVVNPTLTATNLTGTNLIASFQSGGSQVLGLDYSGDILSISGSVHSWNADSGISRLAAGSLAIGNGTAGDFTGALKLGTMILAGGTSNTLVLSAANSAINFGSNNSGPTGLVTWLNNVAQVKLGIGTGEYTTLDFEIFSAGLTGGAGDIAVFNHTTGSMALPSPAVYGWSSTAAAQGTVDSGISRLGAASLAIGNGTASDTTGNLSFNKVIKYAGVATVSGGIPAEYATVDLTAQTGAISGGTLYTPAASGMFRVSWTADITTADSTASVLGGTNGFQVTYTSPTDSVSKTTVAGNSVTSAANTTGTAVGGCLVVYAKTGVAMTYSYGYTATTGNMAYELHIKVEAL